MGGPLQSQHLAVRSALKFHPGFSFAYGGSEPSLSRPAFQWSHLAGFYQEQGEC